MQNTRTNQFTDSQLQSEILAMTGTKNLVWLQQWCDSNQLSRTHWIDLYEDILSIINSSDRQICQEVFSCVQEEMNEIQKQSVNKCKLLGWMIIPSHGLGSHEIYDGNVLLETIFNYSGGYSIYSSKGRILHGDAYSAALDLLPSAILDYKVAVRKLEQSLLRNYNHNDETN